MRRDRRLPRPIAGMVQGGNLIGELAALRAARPFGRVASVTGQREIDVQPATRSPGA